MGWYLLDNYTTRRPCLTVPSWRKPTSAHLLQPLILALLVLTTSGCAVLTKSQVEEVKTFAKAAQEYRILPRTVMEAHRDIRFARRSLEASAHTSGKNLWNELNGAIQQSKKLSHEAERASKALAVLDIYADLLVLLSSDKFTDELDKSATSLGKSLDKGVEAYNKAYKTKYSLIGGTAAAAISGLGRLYIRYKQAMLIKHYVTDGTCQ